MKISFWSVGKANEAYIKTGVEEFTHRISKYFKVEWTIIPVPKNAGMLSEIDLKKEKAKQYWNGWARMTTWWPSMKEASN